MVRAVSARPADVSALLGPWPAPPRLRVGGGSPQTVKALGTSRADHPVRATSGHPAVTNHVAMRASQRRARRIRVNTAAWPIPALVDRVLATYVEWRETTDAVADTHGRSCVAPTGEQAPRFAAYTAAFDQEETAAAI